MPCAKYSFKKNIFGFFISGVALLSWCGYLRVAFYPERQDRWGGWRLARLGLVAEQGPDPDRTQHLHGLIALVKPWRVSAPRLHNVTYACTSHISFVLFSFQCLNDFSKQKPHWKVIFPSDGQGARRAGCRLRTRCAKQGFCARHRLCCSISASGQQLCLCKRLQETLNLLSVSSLLQACLLSSFIFIFIFNLFFSLFGVLFSITVSDL